ncbi:MAG: glucokinase [Rhodobacteraceae bacterium]|nr:glucokinase [Paracoccaceae bacterium]
MTILVADIGGTNSRLALVVDGVPTSVKRFTNTDFASFYDILTLYCDEYDNDRLQGGYLAIAGPVTSTRAQLTNLNWEFDAGKIAKALPGSGPVHLVNDLVALGYSLAGLGADQLSVVKPSKGMQTNGQALVLGLGTGVNICLVKSAGGRGQAPLVIEAEQGHASLPQSVWAVLQDEIGDAAALIKSTEELFSGRGLSRLYGIVSGGEDRDGADIAADYGNEELATHAIDLSARLLGVFAREMVFQYLPLGGIYLAGSVARGILETDARASFLKAFEADGPFSDLTGQVPVNVITDDAAALTGVARYANIAN